MTHETAARALTGKYSEREITPLISRTKSIKREPYGKEEYLFTLRRPYEAYH